MQSSFISNGNPSASTRGRKDLTVVTRSPQYGCKITTRRRPPYPSSCAGSAKARSWQCRPASSRGSCLALDKVTVQKWEINPLCICEGATNNLPLRPCKGRRVMSKGRYVTARAFVSLLHAVNWDIGFALPNKQPGGCRDTKALQVLESRPSISNLVTTIVNGHYVICFVVFFIQARYCSRRPGGVWYDEPER